MAEIISKVSEKIKTAANVTVKKTKSVAAVAMSTVQLKSLKSDLNKCYKKLGMALYEQVRNDRDMDEVIALRISEADDILNEISKVKAEIERKKAELSKSKDEPIEAQFEIIDDDFSEGVALNKEEEGDSK